MCLPNILFPMFIFAFIFHCHSFSPSWPLAFHISINKKNNVEKDTSLLLFFLSKSLGSHVISFQIKPRVAFGLPYLLIELFYIGMPVVWTDGRSLGVRSRDY